jgi:hypothetical protein
MMDTPGMDKWDKTFNKHEIVQELPEENGIKKAIEYLFVKFPLMMDNRDIVQEKKIWDEYNGTQNCFLSVSKSIEHPSRPPQKKVVRAEMIISGMFLCENTPGETTVYTVNQVDLKIKTGGDLVNSIAKKAPKDFIENLIKHCKKMSK